MANNNQENKENQEPIRLVDENDRSLTLVDQEKDAANEEQTEHSEEDRPSFEARVDEETAAEYAAVGNMAGDRPVNEERVKSEEAEARETALMNEDDVTAGRGVGTFAIVLSILSLFFLPVLLGAAGIVVGFVARRYGAKALGNWAIGIGALSIIMTVFFSPFF
ncbi:DUF4190 domain-containing protein [Halalkalibacterium ligniniphilum]|uniref:DUF4190 domain-containing protein n=1 Tax=Halalkalibacterium ligniniphilum TaxID=1134413 RepID=UPI0003484A07|nr:DUF4190 domain-containing protein [Halalkalibacterium ligniniphilum]